VPTPVLDPERHRASNSGEDWIREARERGESRAEEDLLVVLERLTKTLLDATAHYVEPRPRRRRRYLAELKRSTRQVALAEAFIERERIFRGLAEWWRRETRLM
jgi:hypothetical protein